MVSAEHKEVFRVLNFVSKQKTNTLQALHHRIDLRFPKLTFRSLET